MTVTTRSTRIDSGSCWRLLRTTEVGRLCYTAAVRPVVRPVPFVVDGEHVFVAMGLSATTSGAFARPHVVAFEAGEWISCERRGWSVQLVGKAIAVPGYEYVSINALGLTSWIDGEPSLFVRITSRILSGQRVFEGTGQRQ